MTRLLMLVEGQSEETFVKRTLAPHLTSYGVFVAPVLLWTKRTPSGGGFRGGVSNWKQIRTNLNRLLQDSNAWVTTLLDFYGLPKDFLGYGEAHGIGDPRKQVNTLQAKLAEEVNHPRFIPFFALHEFEAWLFCSPETVSTHFGKNDLADKMREIVQDAGEPELINHGEKTHPKARLRNLEAAYKETSDGPTLIAKIGIPAIMESCPHFADWLHQLEGLGNAPSSH